MATFRISSYSYDQHARKGGVARMQGPSAVYTSPGPLHYVTVSPPKQRRPTSAHAGTGTGRRPVVTGDTDHDFNGVTNVMRKISINSNRRWRPSRPSTAWSVDTGTGADREGALQSDSRSSLASQESVSGQRRAASESELTLTDLTEDSAASDTLETQSESGLSPKTSKPGKKGSDLHRRGKHAQAKLRYGVRTFNSAPPKNYFEETLPPCLKLLRSYQGYPKRQNCHHSPVKSVTGLNSHQIKSRSLPHPGLGANGKRRPWSAPPSRSSAPSAPNNNNFRPGAKKARQRPQSAHPVMNNALKSSLSTGNKATTTTVRFDLVARPPGTPCIEEAEEEEGEVEIVGRPDSANSNYSDDFDEVPEEPGTPPDHNGTFHYVYGGKPEESATNVVLAIEDSDNDEIPEDIN